MTTIKLVLFGAPRLQLSDALIESFPTRRCLYLLARLATITHHRVSRVEMAQTLWPDEPYDASGPRLRQELVRLRRLLGEELVLGTSSRDVWLNPETFASDVQEFERLRRGDHEAALKVCTEPFMSGSHSPWIEAERRRLTNLRYQCLLSVASRHADFGRFEEARDRAEDATKLIPAREEAHRLLIGILRDAGRITEAMARLQDMRTATASSVQASPAVVHLAASLSSYDCAVTPFGLAPQLIGRQLEVEQVRAWLDPAEGLARLVTILGPGGVGKTHLLNHLCRSAGRNFAGLVTFVDLSEVSEPTLVPDSILRALGMECHPTDDPLDRVLSVIPNAPFLLALDNVEQFQGRLGPFLVRLLESHPLLRVCVTSRTALAIRGEHRLILRPLRTPPEGSSDGEIKNSESVQLLLRAIAASGVGESIGDGDWEVVAGIVRQLEGMPLGLQLAASPLRSRSPQSLLEGLRRTSLSLESDELGLPDRHRSLRAAIEGSFTYLSLELQQALASLSVFRGGWTEEAAEQVCELSSSHQVITNLLDSSLIERIPGSTTPRFRMLESVREYAREKLTEPQFHNLQARHLRWVEGLSKMVASETVDEEMLGRYAQIEAEGDNIREAIHVSLERDPTRAFSIAGNLATFWRYRTSGFEAANLYRQLFAAYGHLEPTPEMLRAAMGNCQLVHILQAHDRREVYERAQHIADALNASEVKPAILTYQAFLAQNLMSYVECEEKLNRVDCAIKYFPEHPTTGFYFRLRGIVAQYRGDLSEALRYTRASVQWYRERGDVFQLARAKTDLAEAAIKAPDLALAEATLSGLVEDIQRIRYTNLLPACHFAHARLLEEKLRFVEALEHLELARAMWTRLGDSFQIAEQDMRMAIVHRKQGSPLQSAQRFLMAAERWCKSGSRNAAAIALAGVADHLWNSGHRESAQRVLAAAHHQFREAPPRYIPSHHQMVSDINVRIGDSKQIEPVLTLEEATALGARLLPGS